MRFLVSTSTQKSVARIRENPEAGDTDDEEVSPGFVHLPSFAGPRVWI